MLPEIRRCPRLIDLAIVLVGWSYGPVAMVLPFQWLLSQQSYQVDWRDCDPEGRRSAGRPQQGPTAEARLEEERAACAERS